MADSNQAATVSIIGTGNMGSALAEAALAAGLTVTVWNRTASKCGPLVDKGARLAASPEEAARASKSTVVCVTDHQTFVSLIHSDAVAEALEDKYLLQLGVVTAEQSRQTGTWAETRNIGYLEGSILGLPHNVKEATATLICSGPESRYTEVTDLLSIFGSPQLVSEVVGNAYEFDKIYYSFAYATIQGFIQGAALAEASGFSIDAYSRIVQERVPVFVENLGNFGKRIADRNHDGNQASLDVWADAYASSLELCRSLGVDDTLPAAIMQNFEKARAHGYGDREITSIFEVLLPGGGSATETARDSQ